MNTPHSRLAFLLSHGMQRWILLWAAILALSVFSYYVHLLTESVDRSEQRRVLARDAMGGRMVVVSDRDAAQALQHAEPAALVLLAQQR